MRSWGGAAALLLLAGCGSGVDALLQDTNVAAGGFADGTFAGASSPDDLGATGEVELTIAGGDITQVTFRVRQPDGTLKDAEYGKVGGEILSEQLYQQAQKAVAAQVTYAQELEALDDLSQVDVVTGASITYKSFVGAVADALAKARL
ncbi:MAG: FMN-binding protein [Propionibacteriaceae bacterium]|nr:FMN-binding protein [Propionibacteriaceae bacterium]